MYRLFSWEHSYFSGKARAYLRFKERAGSLAPGWEDILATPELIMGLLVPRSGCVDHQQGSVGPTICGDIFQT